MPCVPQDTTVCIHTCADGTRGRSCTPPSWLHWRPSLPAVVASGCSQDRIGVSGLRGHQDINELLMSHASRRVRPIPRAAAQCPGARPVATPPAAAVPRLALVCPVANGLRALGGWSHARMWCGALPQRPSHKGSRAHAIRHAHKKSDGLEVLNEPQTRHIASGQISATEDPTEERHCLGGFSIPRHFRACDKLGASQA